MDIDPEDLKIALHYLAQRQIEATADYLRRGRPLQILSDDELKDRFVDYMRAWHSNPEAYDRSEADDVHAELDLREIDAPYERVKDEFECIRKRCSSIVAELPPEEHEAANEDILASYARSTRSKN